MHEIFQEHPKDADVAALYAEAVMNQRPWSLYDFANTCFGRSSTQGCVFTLIVDVYECTDQHTFQIQMLQHFDSLIKRERY